MILLLSVLLAGVIGGVDSWVTPEVSMALFYLAPVAITAIKMQMASIVYVSIMTAAIWCGFDLYAREYSSVGVLCWNFIVRLTMLLAIGHLIFVSNRQARYYQQLAGIDELTSALNRRAFLSSVEDELSRARRFNCQFSIAYIDLDNFKKVNDEYGHAAGDQILCMVADTLKIHLRSTDLVARVGGDEFTVLLVQTDSSSVRQAFDKCYLALKEKLLVNGMGVTASVGVVTYTRFHQELGEIISKADAWMYRVKKSGKNQIVYRMDFDVEDEASSRTTGKNVSI